MIEIRNVPVLSHYPTVCVHEILGYAPAYQLLLSHTHSHLLLHLDFEARSILARISSSFFDVVVVVVGVGPIFTFVNPLLLCRPTTPPLQFAPPIIPPFHSELLFLILAVRPSVAHGIHKKE